MLRKKLGDILVENGDVSAENLEKALGYNRATGKPIGEILLQLGFVSDKQLLKALAVQQSVDSWDLVTNPPDPEALNLVPAEICSENMLIPVSVSDNLLTVAMRDPGDLQIVDLLNKITRKRIDPVQASDTQLTEVLNELCQANGSFRSPFESFVSEALADIRSSQPTVLSTTTTVTEEETRPVIAIVNQILNEAAQLRASDIHIEPGEKEADVRYRIDGRLMRLRQIPNSLVRMVVARIKVMAELDISNHRVAQDGHFQLDTGTCLVDLRVSVMPSQHGSRVVIRLLDRSNGLMKLERLGFTAEAVELLREVITKPHGIVLVTGPTGSGKTTTLYSALSEVKDESLNIMTCEDPIEIDIKGINQCQVNEKAGQTFASQLRAILRQDPDVILVGEIRDKETAEVAVRAALTGHLVLSTLHCNDAASAVPRLVDMGVDPFLLGSSLTGIVGQRLLRVLCPHCRQRRAASHSEIRILEEFGYEDETQIWAPRGCKSCSMTGYYGRVASHEILPLSKGVTDLVRTCATPEAIREAAIPYGFIPIQQDAMWRAVSGQTSLDEVKRVIFFETLRQKSNVTTSQESKPRLRLAS